MLCCVTSGQRVGLQAVYTASKRVGITDEHGPEICREHLERKVVLADGA